MRSAEGGLQLNAAALLSRITVRLSGEGPRRLAATVLLLLGLSTPRASHAQPVHVELAADSGAASASAPTQPIWQTLSFTNSGLQVLSGNLELLLATWTAHCQNLQNRAMPGGSIRGMVFQRQLQLNASNGQVLSRILAFGPAWPGGSTSIDFYMEAQGEPSSPPCALANPIALTDLPHGVPERFTWWGRLAVPIAWPQGTASQHSFVEQVRSAADRFHWVLETQLGNGEWESFFMNADFLERSFQNNWRTQEDWYFNPQTFSLHARVLSLHWQDSDGRQFRYRLREG